MSDSVMAPPGAAPGAPADPPPARPPAAPAAPPAGRLCGWGRVYVPGAEVFGEDLARATEGAVLTRGLGRSYGDSSLPPPSHPVVVNTTLADRLLSFDEATGLLRCEAGASLLQLNQLFLPRCWFTPVSPGTQFVTVGGMVASDIHGKNHHRDGCFGEHVEEILLRVADGRIVRCTATEESELFRATIGGMGLTGHILEVAFRMRKIPSPWIKMESERVPDIDAYVAGLKAAGPDWPFTMGWIDCLSRGDKLGRGILMRGRWARADEAPSRFAPMGRRIGMPFVLPSFVMGPLTVRAFNMCYYGVHPRLGKRALVHPQKFFYPLDAIEHWNRLYGPRGFTQYQCVLPEAAGISVARRFLELLTGRGGASFLCVIKDCGPEGTGMLSFPMPGISIAVDLPIRKNMQELVDALNEFVVREGGRIYLTKDTFTRPEHFRQMEPRLTEWQRVRDRWDPDHRLRSAQSVRMFGDRP